MAISLTYKKIAYLLPEGITSDSTLGKWLSHKDLSHIDRGDEMLKDPSADQANDHKLGKLELFQAVMEEYQSTYQDAVRVAVQSDNPAQSKKWTEKARHLNELAGMIRELGYEPAFHINFLHQDYRPYYLRMIRLIKDVPFRERNNFGYFYKLYSNASIPCKQGGLGLDYPLMLYVRDSLPFLSFFGLKESKIMVSAEESVRACEMELLSDWGQCGNTRFKIALLAFAALAVYKGTPPHLFSITISNQPFTIESASENSQSKLIGEGHLFFGIQLEGEKIESLDPSDIGFMYYSGAQESYSKTTNMWRDFLSNYYNVQCSSFLTKEDFTRAEFTCRQAKEMNPTTLVMGNISELLMAQEKFPEAEKVAIEILKKEPRNPRIKFDLGTALVAQNKFNQAEIIFKELLDLLPDNKEMLALYGISLSVQKNKKLQAIALIEKSVRLGLINPSVLTTLAKLYLEQNKLDAAEEVLKKCLEYDPNHIPALKILGLIYDAKRKGGLAKDCFNRILKTTHKSPEDKKFAEDKINEIDKSYLYFLRGLFW